MSASLTLDQLKDHLDKRLDVVDTRFDRLEKSLSATDVIVTALYRELVQTKPNHRDRLTSLERNVRKLIEITPGAGELQQDTYIS